MSIADYKHRALILVATGAIILLLAVHFHFRVALVPIETGPQNILYGYGGMCGDGDADGGEQCDDGNTSNDDGCDDSCQIEDGYNCTGFPSICNEVCGDGQIVGSEECDDNNANNSDGCSSACTIELGYECTGEPSMCAETCGDGLIIGAEECDDSNTNSGDGCSALCIEETGYQCTGQPSACNEVCGDGQIVGAEECDDTNTTNGDGCSSLCIIETGYECTGIPSVCSVVCGDGLVVATEECDDGNLTNDDGCTNACFEESGYTCTGQPSSCATTCGDGIIVGVEVCDDGNTSSGDGCSSACLKEDGYICAGEPSVCSEFSNNICNTNVLAYWKLDEGTGSTILDAYSNTNTGTIMNASGIGWSDTNKPSLSFSNPYLFDFDGIDDYIDLQTNVLDIDSSFSVSLWMHLQGANAGTIIGNRGSGVSGMQDGWKLGVVGTQVLFQLEDGGSFDTLQGGSTLSITSWQHIAITFNSLTGKKIVYVNGVQDFTNTTPSLIGADFTSGRNSVIGALWNSAGVQSAFWPGMLDDIRVYNRLLTQSEISFLSNGGDTATGCIDCGNGVVHFTEECDDNDNTNGDGCSSMCKQEVGFSCSGEPTVCSEICGDNLTVGIEQCDDGIANSDTVADACRTTCVSPKCGDTVKDTGEFCDDGNANNTDACTTTCAVAKCGDGYIQANVEQCEPPSINSCTASCVFLQSGRGGGRASSSAASSATSSKSPPPVGCGNNILEEHLGEECDTGDKNGASTCSYECKLFVCGDGEISPQLGEECEPIPFAAKDGSIDYKVPECGKFCVPPNMNEFKDDDSCTFATLQPCPGDEPIETQNTLPTCGDGKKEGNEECDEGGTCYGGKYDQTYWTNAKSATMCINGGGETIPISGDGCSEKCKIEFCGDGIVQGRGPDQLPGTEDDEQCDNGSICSNSSRRCYTDSDCSNGGSCIYNADEDTKCSSLCQVLTCVYTLKFDISDLGEGTHSFRVSVTDPRGLSDNDATIFTIAQALGISYTPTDGFAQYIDPASFQSEPSSALLAQLGGRKNGISTTLKTDVEHYIKSEDLAAILTCQVYDEHGNPVCGLHPNSFVLHLDGGEVKDNPFVESTGGRCGDGVRQLGEDCDDGNKDNNDACNNTCTLKKSSAPVVPLSSDSTTLDPVCGDGTVNEFESCDDGNEVSGDGCSNICTIEQYCGDGTIQTSEQCDDGNTKNNDGCSRACVKEVRPERISECGNGFLDQGEQCDRGELNSDVLENKCRTNCMLPFCGDGTVDTDEQCDNGTRNSDTEPDYCRTDCTLPKCGDKVIDIGEECDEGENCTSSCFTAYQPICGNGVLDETEQCDDGNLYDDDDCSAMCTIIEKAVVIPELKAVAVCGDAFQEESEECDDGNTNNGDGCNAFCLIEIPPEHITRNPDAPQPIVVPKQEIVHPAPQQLPFASLIPVQPNFSPIGDTGPAAATGIAIGISAGIGWMRRKKNL